MSVVLIVIIAVCALMLVWCVKNANNFKGKNKKSKEKDKKQPEEKFKEVIPKEKTQKKTVIKESLKKDIKKKEDEKASVSKITKDDFKNNDMLVPTALLSDAERTEKAKEIARQGKPTSPKGLDFNFDSDLKNFKSPLGDPFKFDDDLDSLFGASKKPVSSPLPTELPAKPKLDMNFMDDEFGFDPFDEPSETRTGKDAFSSQDLSERITAVFGSSGKKLAQNEVIVGDIISEPRSRVNRLNRRKYF